MNMEEMRARIQAKLASLPINISKPAPPVTIDVSKMNVEDN